MKKAAAVKEARKAELEEANKAYVQ